MRGAKLFNVYTGALAAVLLLGASTAEATLLGLKQVQVSGGSQVDLLFDGKINKKQIQTEFFKDIVQISLSDTAVYPAKISSVNGGSLTKIFAYQYTPKLVRCRFSVKGQAEDYKDRVEVTTNGKILTVRIGSANSGDRIASTAAKAVEAKAESAPKDAPKIDDPEQKKLLERVMKEEATEASAPEKKAQPEKSKSEKSKPLAGGKPLPSPFRVFGKLAAIFALFGAIALVLRKFLRGNPLLSRLAKKGIGKKKMIEVLSNHHLGPKKSIAVVRVGGRTMVLGITDESINLITQLGSEAGESAMNMEIADLEELGLKLMEPEASKAVDPQAHRLQAAQKAQLEARQLQAAAAANLKAAAKPDFSELLSTEARKPSVSAPVNNSALLALQNYDHANGGSAVRARIKNRLEGLKQL